MVDQTHPVPRVFPPPDSATDPADTRPTLKEWLLTTTAGLLALLGLSLFGWWLWREWGFLVWLNSDRTFCL